MAKPRYLTRRGEVFQFRIRLCRDLRIIVGRAETSRSLQTGDFAEACRRLPSVWAWWTDIMAIIRTEGGLTRDGINELLKDFVETEFDKFGALRRSTALAPSLSETLAREITEKERTRKLLVWGIANDDHRFKQVYFDEFLEARGFKIDRSTAGYKEAIRRLAPAWLEALSLMELDSTDLETTSAELPLAPVLRGTTPPTALQPMATTVKSIGVLIEPYMRERQRGDISASYQTEIRIALSWFTQWFGANTKVAALTPENMRDYKDGLLLLPSNWAKKLKGVSIRDAATLNEDGHMPRLEVQALVAKRWLPVVDFLTWAHRDLYSPSNPAAGLKITVSKSHKKAKRRDQFEPEELRAIFNAPVFTGAFSDRDWQKPGTNQIRDYRFWLPLLALFTGGRRGELCPLRVEDAVERDGILCIRIREHFDEDGEKVASLKNDESVRLVPIHPELTKIGFGNLVNQRCSSGHERLFDCVETNNFDQFGKWFSRFLTSIGVKTRRNTFHSFRHSMEQAMRENIDDFTARFRLTGRTVGHSSGEYGKGHTVKTLYQEISKIEYEGLDLSLLYDVSKTSEL